MTEDDARKIYQVLIEECGAPHDAHSIEHFARCQARKFMREFRFCGMLGFGGKFWRNNNRWYVSAYPEDIGRYSLQPMIDKTNARLALLLATFSEDSQ